MRQSDMGIFRRHHRSLSDGPCLHHVEGMEKPLFPVRGYRPDIRFPLDEIHLIQRKAIIRAVPAHS